MKVLFAVNNDDISNAIVKKYQKDYKEILSYKSVYYFNAILKELQKDKTYDRVVISEDLEPFANNNYDAIDKFLFDKLDNISDEAINERGKDTEIILICTDRRTKNDDILVKLFGIGIYNAIIGQDRSIDEVCKLINSPRTKKSAKIYYNIDAGDVNYQHESEDSVSETEVQNILAHYKRLGRNEEKYVESFNNIASQYNENQLKIIVRYLPISVKAVLEEQCPRYQELVSSGDVGHVNFNRNKDKEETKQDSIKVKMLENESEKANIKGKIVIPSKINKSGVKKLIKKKEVEEDNDLFDELYDDENIEEDEKDVFDLMGEMEEIEEPKMDEEIENIPELGDISAFDDISELDDIPEVEEPIIEEPVVEPKRGRGRPRKIVPAGEEIENKPKRGRGRPKKVVPVPVELEDNNDKVEDEEIEDDDLDLFNLGDDIEDTDSMDSLDNIEEEKDPNEIDLLDDNLEAESSEENEEDDDIDLFNLTNDNDLDLDDEDNEDIDLFNIDDDSNSNQKSSPVSLNEELKDNEAEEDDEIDLFNLDEDNEEEEEDLFGQESDNDSKEIAPINSKPQSNSNYDSSLLSKDKKVVSFVGTTKNGTSFIVNNVAHLLASRGIRTAVLDMTKTRNAYYIYTNSEQKLMDIAKDCIYKLRSGVAEGIEINKNLSIYTSVPEDNTDYSDVKSILETLTKNYEVVLIDTDFDTPVSYFDASQEIYLVQSMDVLTMQPLTAFLRNLQSKGVLKEEKLRVVINKSVNIKSVSVKVLIGGISKYNDPSMSFMKDLFNKDTVKYCQIPFEVQNYIKYLDSVITCKISLNGYTGGFISALNELGNMIYPVLNNTGTFTPRGNNAFSDEMNDTLNKMKKYQ